MTARHDDWQRQGINDLEWAKHSLGGGFYAQASFISQQAGEKLLKALCFKRGNDLVKTHSLMQIVTSLKINGELEKIARELDIFYIAGRYPDAFPAGAPFEMITREQAEKAVAAAERLSQIVLDMLNGGAGND
jgi:HEPN domain-containing protein